MKRLLLASVGLVALAGSASAADLPARMPTKAPVVAPAYFNWSGCYIGGHLGGGAARTDFVNVTNTTFFGDLSPGNGFADSRGSGVFGGGQLGCNIQTGALVFGIEGTASGTGIGDEFTNTTFGAAIGRDDVFNWRLNWIGTVQGRLGFAVNNWLLYAKGGYAGTDVRFRVTDVGAPNVGSGSQSRWHNGWTVGGGLEYAMTPNWILGVEGSYYRFDTRRYDLNGTEAGAAYTFDLQPRDVFTVVGRMSYKFGWDQPVMARY